ncbi:rab11 family-interacting protein 3 isoform X1 [Myripristis murdjan]|uniref:RAB11 family interacting protein 3 (class II) n=1 Tax=Myripristis murdjan TaxID=586833 RepID=A0A667Y1C2_9TELE|nr:rab11 family-interacting protein 3 isoform X1 [Myripristis murdjan]
MEPTVLSGPLGHSEWESDQPFPHGFHTLDSNKGGMFHPNKSGQTGLDFTNVEQDDMCQHSKEEEVFQDNILNLDDLFKTSSYSYGDSALQLQGDRSTNSEGALKSTHLEELSSTDKIEGLDDISDCALSWLFSPSLTGLIGENSACEEVNLTQDAPVEDTSVVGGHGELITLSEPSSPLKISERTSETSTEASFLLVDLISSEQLPSCLVPESSGEVSLQGVGEEQVLLSLGEDGGLPPAQGGETLSPETGDKGFFLEPVANLPIASNTTPQGLPDSCLPHNHISTPPEFLEGSVPLLDLEVPDCDSNLSLCPTSPASLISIGVPLDSPTQESQEEHILATAIENQTSEHQSEDDSFVLSLSTEPSSLAVTQDGDAFVQDDFPCSSNSAQNGSEDLMDGKICSEAKNQGDEAMALHPCLITDELHNEETWDVKPLEGVQNESVPNLQTEEVHGERVTSSAQLPESDCDKVASLDFPVQELSSSPEPGWTSEQTVETVSLSKMVVADSMPMVSTVNTREEDVSPLKAVFDALDQDGDGFVRIEEFMEFAAAYGADQVKDLTKFLDPSGLGVISFEDFHRGISAISNGGPEPQLYDVHYSPGDGAVGCPEEYDEQNEVTDSAYLGSESTYSECETFTDEDTGALVPPEMHEDVETDSGIEATLHDPEEGSNRFSLNSELHNHSLVTVIGGEEEQFEDFGESNTSELLLESTVEGTAGQGDSSLLQPPEQVNGSSLLLSPSAGKRLSSKKVARHLLQNSSMTLDTMSDLTRDILELADNDITDKVLLLERRVAELEKESEASGEQHARLRQENLQLVHRANALEEQLKEQELRADEHLQQEVRRHKEALSKLERERGLELENLQARLQQLDEENSELRSCVPCLRANIERLEEERRKLQDDTENMTDRLNEELESRRKMSDKLSHERHLSQKDKECTQELIEDLRKQLEHLQLYKLEAEAKRGRSPSAGLQEYQTRTREAELEQEIKRLKQDNRSLKEQNDELNGQIINLSIQGAKNLMSASFSDSLAAEINSVSRGELMEAIHKQEEINYRLQDYIDKIIVAIMESNPSILEVK